MKGGTNLSVEPVGQISSKTDPAGAQARKYDGKRETDLSEKLQGLVGIIPDVQPQPFVYDDSGDKLQRDNKEGTSQNLYPHRILPFYHLPLPRTEQKTDTAKHKHRPVGKAAEQDFKTVIQAASKSP